MAAQRRADGMRNVQGPANADDPSPQVSPPAARPLQAPPDAPWHALSAEAALQMLGSTADGLSAAEAARRRQQFGPNVIAARKGPPWWMRFLLQLHAPLVYILIVAGVVTSLLGDYTDAAVIFGVVLANAIIGFVQENKAVRAIDALSRAMRVEATVKRDNRHERLDAADLVLGDVLLLEPGDKVPADVRLLDTHEFRVDESMLTGESLAVAKEIAPLETPTPLSDRRNMAYAGSLVTSGAAEGVVVATGNATEVGRISELISRADDVVTPLLRKIAGLSNALMWIIVTIAAIAFIAGILRHEPAADMFMAAVALAVGAIPEGLPAAVTIMLAVGVSRMARRRAFIRKLPAVEALGSTTVICSDKTGTLTQNQMTVQLAWVHPSAFLPGGRQYAFTGAGYDPAGEIVLGGSLDLQKHRPNHESLAETLICGALCNDASLARRDGAWRISGDPTEAALLVATRKGGFSLEALLKKQPRLDLLRFESARQYMATLHASERQPDAAVIYVKGSVERLVTMCHSALSSIGTILPLDVSAVLSAADELASAGLRVLAFARCDLPAAPDPLTHDSIEQAPGGLVFLGLQGMLDLPRLEAIDAVAACRRAGIHVKMITGDHALTAATIARMVGIEDARPEEPLAVLTGAELAALPDEQLPDRAEETAVFARMIPEQKLRLVKALQRRGHVVAMTGDGVNDAPALRQADIGIAMGITGTEVAKDAADIVLADDNFATIEAAVEEGREVFANLTKFILWTLPTNFGEGFLIFSAILLGWPLPILPVHALYINMSTAILLGMPLIFEAPEPGVMSAPPRDPRQPLLTFELFMRTSLVSLLLCVGGMGVFHWELARGTGDAAAQTAAVSVIVAGEMLYLFSSRALLRPAWAVPLFSNPWLLAGLAAMAVTQVLFAQVPLCNRLFHSAPIDGVALGRVLLVAVVLLVVVECEKAIRRALVRARTRDLPAP